MRSVGFSRTSRGFQFDLFWGRWASRRRRRCFVECRRLGIRSRAARLRLGSPSKKKRSKNKSDALGDGERPGWLASGFFEQFSIGLGFGVRRLRLRSGLLALGSVLGWIGLGQIDLNQIRLAKVRLGEVTFGLGYNRLGQVWFGQVTFRLGQVGLDLSLVGLGQVRLGQIRFGLGQVRLG